MKLFVRLVFHCLISIISGWVLGANSCWAQIPNVSNVSFNKTGLSGGSVGASGTGTGFSPQWYEAKLEAIEIKDAAGTTFPLGPVKCKINEQRFDPKQAAFDLLVELRRAAQKTAGVKKHWYFFRQPLLQTRSQLKGSNAYAAQLLFPRGRLFQRPARWHWPWRRYRDAGNQKERRIATSFLAQLEEKLRAEWKEAQKLDSSLRDAVGTMHTTVESELAAKAASPDVGSIIYTTEKPLATTDGTRLLHFTIRDLGSHVLSRGSRRYLVCVSYAAKAGEYTSNRVANGCPSMPRNVTAAAELESLNQRELFVKDVASILDTANLWRVDGLSSTALGQVEARKATLAQRRRESVVASLDQQEAQALFDADIRATGVSSDFITHVVDLMATNNKKAAALLAETTAATDVRADFLRSRGAIKVATLNHDIVSLSASEVNNFQSLLTDIFIDFTKQQERSNAAPMAGVMEIQNSVPAQDNFDNPTINGTFLTDSIQLVIEDGNVEELKAVGRLNGHPVLFETYAPIGISSDRDLRRSWPRQWLWTQADPAGFDGKRAYIKLSDLLRYTANMQANGKDRSPADGVYTLHPTDGLARRSLPRLTTIKLLQARVYTDLGGINGVSKPNGLIQVEVSKKLEWGVGWSKRSRAVQFRLPGYFLPLVAVTKIEQQNRFLPLLRAPGAVPRYTINTIDLVRYANLRVGGDFNVAGVRLAALKSDFYLDASIYLNRVDIRDSIQRPNSTKLMRVDSTLNVVMYGIGLITRFRPDSRYGVQSRIGFYRYNLVNNLDQNNQVLIEQRPYITGLNPAAHTQWDKYRYQGVMQYELLAWASLSENSRVFFRPQFSHLLYQSNHTYFQFQIGYQFDVFTDSDKREKAVPVKSFW